jgi:hypothetical protein
MLYFAITQMVVSLPESGCTRKSQARNSTETALSTNRPTLPSYCDIPRGGICLRNPHNTGTTVRIIGINGAGERPYLRVDGIQ